LLFGEGNWQEGSLRFGGAQRSSEFVEPAHAEPRPFGIGLSTLPADRFLSLRPVNWEMEGLLQTRPLIFSGQHLLVNADVAAEDLQVAVLDEGGNPLPGFTHEDSVAERHDKLRYRIAWISEDEEKSLRDVPRDQSVALQFRLRNGDLYAFQQID
jgi:hypothetical protein